MDPYADWRAQNPQQQGGGGGSFDDFLSSLPSPQQIAPLSPYVSGRQGETGVGPNMVPMLWKLFAPTGESIINRQAMERFRGGAEGMAAGRRDFERRLTTAFGSSGLNPGLARGIAAEKGATFSQGLGELQAGVEDERLGSLFDMFLGITNALGQANESERNLALEAFMNSKARRAARHGAKNAFGLEVARTGLGALDMLMSQGSTEAA